MLTFSFNQMCLLRSQPLRLSGCLSSLFSQDWVAYLANLRDYKRMRDSWLRAFPTHRESLAFEGIFLRSVFHIGLGVPLGLLWDKILNFSATMKSINRLYSRLSHLAWWESRDFVKDNSTVSKLLGNTLVLEVGFKNLRGIFAIKVEPIAWSWTRYTCSLLSSD